MRSMSNKAKEVLKLFDESMTAEDTVIMMRGLSIMFEEFLEGNTIQTFNNADASHLMHLENRISDMLIFAIKTLSAGADRLHNETVELESRIIDALSDEGEV